MALTDLLRGVGKGVRSAVLGVALAGWGYGCGGEKSESKQFCELYYMDLCPQERFDSEGGEDNLKTCQQYCDELKSPRYQQYSDCAFIACAVETGYCDEQVQGDPQIGSCLESYGWECGENRCEPPQQ